MLRLKVIANHDGSLEATGAFADDLIFVSQKRYVRPDAYWRC
jgi:hypothetical protein